MDAPPSWPASLPPLSGAPGRGGHFDLERTRLVVDLKRAVVDVKALLEQVMQRPAHLVTVVAGAHYDVRGQRGEARGDLPHVQVVDLDHAGLGN
jgi:hypothetical protein